MHYKNGNSHSWEIVQSDNSDSAYWAAEVEGEDEPCEGIYCVTGLGEGEGPANDVPDQPSNNAPSIQRNLVNIKFKNREETSCKFCFKNAFNALNSSTKSVFYSPNTNCTAS